MDALSTILSYAAFLVVLLAVLLLLQWSIMDAKRRGKPAVLVSLAVVVLFPFGLIAWLLFRPEPIDPSKSRRPFRLADYRVQ